MRRTASSLAIILIAFVWTGCNSDQAPVAPNSDLTVETAAKPAGGPVGLDVAIAAQDRNTGRLMALTGVVGTATGLGSAGNPAVLVLVESAGHSGIPGNVDGVPVIVRVTGKIVALKKPDGKGKPPKDPPNDPPPPEPTPKERWPRPVPIGISTGHPDITAGTIGCRVTNGTVVFALSNNHVYANENLATIGNAVIQPGTFDGGTSPADDIGTLDDFEPIDFTPGATNLMDAAIALSSTALLGNATPSSGYGTPKSATLQARINQKVKKFGRTTGQTSGNVFAINATVNVGYDTGVARFVGQIIITPGNFSAGGDSGSLIVAVGKGRNKGDERRPLGLLFAGSPSITIATPIDVVLNRFGVTRRRRLTS